MSPEPADAGPDAAPLVERRRPGRVAYANSHLIDLMRRPATDAEPQPLSLAEQVEDPDNLVAARGIALGILMAVPLWLVIVLLGWWLI